jgi:hypothetical protein
VDDLQGSRLLRLKRGTERRCEDSDDGCLHIS